LAQTALLRLIGPLNLLASLTMGCHQAAPAPIKLVPAWSAQGEEAGSSFGARAMCAGDLNGRGYDSLIVGAPRWRASRGKAYVFQGSAQGLGAQAAWTATGDAANDQFGDRVGQAGDVNGDGYGDIFISSPTWKGGLGRCVAYYGSARGLGAKPDWSVQAAVKDGQFGDCTHPTGDLDGDGFDDLAVGAYGFDGSRGEILLYRGSAKGLGAAPVWTARGEAPLDWYGYGIGAAGDVYGDGMGSLLAGAKYNDQGGHDAGKAYLYRGGRGGALGGAAWAYWGRKAQANASLRVSTAGDVNGDGYADVLVTAPGAQGDLGELYVFHGGPQGLKARPDETLLAPEPGLEFFGEGACPAGDVDGDGYDDVAVSARDAHGRGRVYVYRGGPQGLQAWPTWEIDGPGVGDRFGWWVAPAGDLDGDGLADLVIGADSTPSGSVYVVYGRQFKAALNAPASPPHARRWTMEGYLPRKKARR
jgi:hypothetical protein